MEYLLILIGMAIVGYVVSCNVYRRGIKTGVDRVTAELYYNKTIDMDTVNRYCCDEFIDYCTKPSEVDE